MNQRETKLKTNFYDIALTPGKSIYEYELEITDSTPELVKTILKYFKNQLQEELINFMFIDQNIYSPTIMKNLDENKRKFLGFFDCQKECQISVCLKLVQRLNSQDVKCGIVIAKLIKLLMRKQLQMVSVGKKGSKLFWSQKAFKFQKQNLEIWPGVECIYRQNLSNNYLPALIIDCAFKVLRYRTVLDEIKQNKNWQDQLRGQIIMTIYNKKFYKIDDIDVNLRPTNNFKNDKQEEITFIDFYKQRYNKYINPNQPLIKAILKENKIDSNGQKQQGQCERIIYLIPELCQMTGLSDEVRNDFNAMKELAQVTKPGGDKRQQSAKDFINQVQASIILNKQTGVKKEVLKDWGLRINQECIDITEKRLNPGNLVMGDRQQFDLSDKQTNLDRQTQTQMFSSPQIQINWAIIYNKKSGQRAFEQFAQNLRQASQEFKFFAFSSPLQYQIEDREEDLYNTLNNLYNEAVKRNTKIDFIVFLLPGQKKKARLYKIAKSLSMNMLGCSSQVVLERTLEKNTRSIVNKILVQLNAKLGGIPWTIDEIPQIFQIEPTMICGLDIFSKTYKRSQLAFCSTIDKNFCQYYSQVVTSGEFSTHLQQCLQAAILAFKQSNQIYPKKIIIYRDGVGEGQEQIVKSTEIPQYQQAIQQIGQPIQLVLVICNKRVSPKFYQTTQNGLQNPQPGTYIDDPKIVNDPKTDFYLISQICRQGTVTPTLYKILHSDIKDIEHNIKILTFKLCWLFYNFTGSIKIPAPIRYAHCLSNFIGDNYDEKDQIKFLPQKDLINKKVLYYI